jgi:hypothetical protein
MVDEINDFETSDKKNNSMMDIPTHFNTIESTNAKERNSSQNLNTESTGLNKGKYYIDVVNEKKNYEDKINSLKNRIRKLQEQEKEINKKTGKLKEKYVLEQKVKVHNQIRKESIKGHKEQNSKFTEMKKQEIENQRKQRRDNLEKLEREKLMKSKVIVYY